MSLFRNRHAISMIGSRGARQPFGSIKTREPFAFFPDGIYNAGGRASLSSLPSAIVVVNLPIAESEHHNFRCRARPARGDISSTFPLSAIPCTTKDAIIAKPCTWPDRSFSRVFRKRATMHRVVADIVTSGA